MANPRAFISFDFDNNSTSKNLFVGQASNSKTPFDIEDWSVKEPFDQSTWEKDAKEKINKCNLMIVLVGKKMSTATGVVKEIKMAKDLNVPYFGVYVDGADAKSDLPGDLQRNRTIEWTWEGVAGAITQLMGEGKNKPKK